MPSYSPIKRWMDSTEKARTAERLLALRRKLRSEVTDRTDRHSVLVATWNLRDFDSNRLGHGPRLRESFYYIAEIVSAFDIVMLQEVSRNLDGLEALMAILGAGWDYLATAANETRGGVEERIVFVYRLDKVQFRKIAGEVALPGGQAVMPLQNLGGRALEGASHQALPLCFVRTPFLAAFEAAGAKLNFCVLHLAQPSRAKPRAERETGDLDALARFFRDRPDREDTVLIGDFGVGAPSDAFAKALERQGFEIAEPLTRKRGLLGGDMFYDQIALRPRKDRLELGNAGVLQPFDAVFRDNDEDFAAYRDLMPEDKSNDLWNGGPRGYYAQQWRTWQISDHHPLWVELKVDFSDHDLDMIRKSGG